MIITPQAAVVLILKVQIPIDPYWSRGLGVWLDLSSSGVSCK